MKEHTMNDERAQVRVNGKIIGGIVDNTFRKHLKTSGFLRRPPAIAYDRQAIEQAQKLGATDLLVIDDDSGKAYRTTIEYFLAKCFVVPYNLQQIALALGEWNKTEDAPANQSNLFGV